MDDKMIENNNIENDASIGAKLNAVQNSKKTEQDIAIQISGVKKRYKLGLITAGTLKGDIQSWWARKRGKEDPTLKIGAKVYGKNEVFWALNGIDLTIYKGERIGIIGHNGAGKSTLLKLLARVTGPTEGEIKIDGRITSMLEVGTGFNDELTGRENIYLNGAILGMTKKEVDRKIEQIIDFSECRQFIDTPVKRYSSGMFVKLAFAVASHLDSEIMIMDEVLAVGDMTFQKKCLEKMSEVSRDEGRTILYVSHNMNTIRQLCSRCIVLNHGQIIFNGDVEEAIGVYLESGSINKMCNHYDFSKRENQSFIPKQAKIDSFSFINKDLPIYYQGETVDCELVFTGIQNIDNASIRFQIYLDGATLIGSSFLDENFAIEKNKQKIIRFSLNTKNFIPAKYTIDLVLFTHDGVGNAKAADIIKRDVSFEICLSKNKDALFWWRNPFGTVKFDNLTFNEISYGAENKNDNS